MIKVLIQKPLRLVDLSPQIFSSVQIAELSKQKKYATHAEFWAVANKHRVIANPVVVGELRHSFSKV